MKGLGNYRFPPTVERKPGALLMYRGGKAVVRFHNGLTYSLPAAGLKGIGVKEGERFTLVILRHGKTVVEVRVERLRAARPARARQATPKVYRRDGRKIVTRKR